MAVFQIPQIDVHNISSDNIFAIDTNILYFLHSGYSFQPGSNIYNKFIIYSNFVGDLLLRGNTLCVSVANMQELCHVIEKKEFERYRNTHHYSPSNFSLKQFRSISSERTRVKSKLQLIYNQITQTYIVYSIRLSETKLQDFLSTYDSFRYDPIDYLFAENCLDEGVDSIITDDHDFQKDTRLNIYVV